MKLIPTTAIALCFTVAAMGQSPGKRDDPGARPRVGLPPKSFTPVPGSEVDIGKAVRGRDANVKKTIELPPEPIPIENLGNPTIPLPDGPIDAYLLRKENGPFMVCAHVFRGPEATRYALALVLELQNEFKLPSYIFHLKIQPGGSNIRNVQPTAPRYVPNADLPEPEKFRVFDEAAVLVGNCGTIDDAEKLLKQVKKIKPKTVDALPSIWGHRKGQGLYRAMITVNPLQAAQNLYPGQNPKTLGPLPAQPGEAFDPFVATAALTQMHKPDELLKRMNRGPHNIYQCPGPYTLPVAEYRGRSSTNSSDSRFQNKSFLQRSPLAKAGLDAEELAAKLTKCKFMQGFEPYVFHDRDRSIVCIGSFTGPDDPNLVRLRGVMLELINEVAFRKFSLIPLSPSPNLLEVPKP